MLISDIPIWEDFPFQSELPELLEVRRGKGLIIFTTPEHQRYVDIAEGELTPTVVHVCVGQLMRSLGYKWRDGKPTAYQKTMLRKPSH